MLVFRRYFVILRGISTELITRVLRPPTRKSPLSLPPLKKKLFLSQGRNVRWRRGGGCDGAERKADYKSGGGGGGGRKRKGHSCFPPLFLSVLFFFFFFFCSSSSSSPRDVVAFITRKFFIIFLSSCVDYYRYIFIIGREPQTPRKEKGRKGGRERERWRERKKRSRILSFGKERERERNSSQAIFT